MPFSGLLSVGITKKIVNTASRGGVLNPIFKQIVIVKVV